MKIAYLISRYPAFSHTFILREVIELRKRGLTIEVASINFTDIPLNRRGTVEQAEVEHTFYVKQQGLMQVLKAGMRLLLSHPLCFLKGLIFAFYLAKTDLIKIVYSLFYFVEALLIGSWMKRQGMTHVHVHFANAASTVALILCKLYPFTFSMTVHGPDEFYDVTLYHLKEKIERANFICCIGFYAKSQLMRLSSSTYWHKLEVSPLGVDIERYVPSIKCSRTAYSLVLPCQLICVGRLVSTKGQFILLSAVKKLLEQGYAIHLNLVGDGPDKESLKKEIDEQHLQAFITLSGALNQAQVLECYQKADIFVLASFAEGIPISLMEAMAMEIPCIATSINGIPELIGSSQEGLLVIPADVESLAQAIKELIDSPKRCQELGKAGRARIKEKYNLQNNSQKLVDIFQMYLDLRNKK